MPLTNILKKYGLFIFLTLVFWTVVLRCIPLEFYDLGGDSAQYIFLGESLTQGKFLRMINYPGEPFSFYYPAVFPLLLFPIIYFLGRNFYLMHLVAALLGYLSLFFFYLIFKNYAGKKIAFFSVILLGLNWTFLYYCANYILSDIPYLFFSSFAFFMATRYIEKPSFLNKQGFLLILGLILSYFTRYIGLTLFLGLLVSLALMNKQDRLKKIFFLAGGFLSVWLLWEFFKYLNPNPVNLASHAKQLFLVDPYAPYKGSLFAHPLYFILRFSEGANYFYNLLDNVFFAKQILPAGLIAGLTLVVLFLGLWVKFREDKGCIFHYYFIIYLLSIIFWPFKEGLRFILPILPFILFYFLIGLKKIISYISKKAALAHLSSIFFVFFIFNLLSLPVVFKYSSEPLPPALKDFVSLHQIIKENVPKEGLILSRKPTITYFYTKHKAVCYPFTLNPEEIRDTILRNRIKYIIVDEFSLETALYLVPFLYKYKDRLKLLHRIGNSSIIEVLETKER